MMIHLRVHGVLALGMALTVLTSPGVPQERLLGTAPGTSSWQNNSWLGWGGATTAPDWRLGVQVDNTDTGVFIKAVSPGSAAARANLEAGDLIIAVGGQQIGFVDRQPIDMGTTIRNRADAAGNVTLLVQDSRTGRLASIRVALDRASAALRGQITFRERISLPPDAQATVTIENITRPLYTVRNGSVTLNAAGLATIPFEIPYDASYIAPSDAYQLRARITSGGRVWFDTLQPVRVLTQGAPADNVQVVVSQVAAPSLAGNTQAPVITAGYSSVDTLIAQYRQAYRRYLGRDPTQLELAAILASPPPSGPNDIAIQLMASQQFYDLMGNNNSLWLTNVFQQVIGRAPLPDELTQWVLRFQQLGGSRTELLRQLFQQKPAAR
jgi:uncharacterized lipoprotein YbaY